MSPAFSSRRQALAFALLLAVLIALPALMAETGWLTRRNVYPTIPLIYGPFGWIQQQIFGADGDVDIAFIGSSHIWTAIDTPYVQQKLSDQLGREATVFTLGWPWPGFDAVYVIARDLLYQRRVRMLVIYDDFHVNVDDGPHKFAHQWFRIGETTEVFTGLPWKSTASLYGCAVLRMPRHLLSLLRPNLVQSPAAARDDYWTIQYRAANVAKQLGSLRARLTVNRNPNFSSYRPEVAATPADTLTYSGESRNAFEFTGPLTPPFQLHFARKLALLCKERATRLVILHVPNLKELGRAVVSERECWPEVLGAPADIVGVPPARLFAGIPDACVEKLFYDDDHLNVNGQDVFTPIIYPELLKLYASSIAHH
jgi:hypothetical protein